MAIYIDQHVHSNVSHDGISTYQEHMLYALQHGISEITFTEHYDVYKNCYDIITFYCPICDKLVKEKEITDAFEKMRNKGARRLKVLTKKYK